MTIYNYPCSLCNVKFDWAIPEPRLGNTCPQCRDKLMDELTAWDEINDLKEQIKDLENIISKKNQALKAIGSAQYGLQGIQEDHEPDSFGYYKEATGYYRDLSHRFQQIAVKAYRDGK